MHKISTLLLVGLCLAYSASAQKSKQKWTALTTLDGYRWVSTSSSRSFGNGANASVSLPNGQMASVVQLDKNKYGLVCLDANMQEVWLSPVNNFPIGFGLKKGRLLIITSNDDKAGKAVYSSNFSGTLYDPTSGKVIAEKNFHTTTDNYAHQPIFFFADNGSFQMAVRKTKYLRKYFLGVAPPDTEELYGSTQNMEVFELDEELNPVKKRVLKVPESGYVSNMKADENGGIVARFVTDKMISVGVFEKGATEISHVVSQAIDTRKFLFSRNLPLDAVLIPSVNNPGHVYESAVFSDASKERVLLMTDYDLQKNTVKTTTESFTKSYISEIVKNYKPANPKFDKVKFYVYQTMKLENMREFNGQLLVTMSPQSLGHSATTGVTYTEYGDILLNVYDKNLSRVNQLAIPRGVIWPAAVETGMYQRDKYLYIFHNMTVKEAVYSKINLSDWSIVNTGFLEKKSKGHVMASEAVLFMSNNVYVPFIDFAVGIGHYKLKPYYVKSSVM